MAWIGQFDRRDQHRANSLLRLFRLVSRDEFVDGLRDEVSRQAARVDGPVALYAERELGHRLGVPHRLFKESGGKHKRAKGVGPQPVKPTKAYLPGVGSEGIVAQLINDLCKEQPKKFLNHPGPDKIRKFKARAFWVLTDLVGSGKRAENYLRAAWKVRSVRSWHSGRFIRFGVIAYAMTSRGEARISRHNSRPLTAHVVPCPTIVSLFSGPEADVYLNLCKRYDPMVPPSRRHESEISYSEDVDGFLGFGGVGALIAFAHGAPNNIPSMFRKASTRADGWTPIFPARVTAGLPSKAFGLDLTSETIAARLNALGQKVLAKSPAAKSAAPEVKKRFLVLATLSRGQRGTMVVAVRTGLTTIEVDKVCHDLQALGWIDNQRRLTDAGIGELRHLRSATAKLPQVVDAEAPKPMYYPSSLRAPVFQSS